MRRSRVRIGALAALAVLVLAGCGASQHPHEATAENNGYYVQAGPLYYQLQVSRELNPYATEDSQYLAGLPAGTPGPTATQLWYGVFLQALNKSQQPQRTTDSFDIVDTQDKHYSPIALDLAVNQYAWRPMVLNPLGREPAPDTTASFGPTQGAMLLFKLDTSVYNNRPLTLEIRVPGTSKVSKISLDL